MTPGEERWQNTSSPGATSFPENRLSLVRATTIHQELSSEESFDSFDLPFQPLGPPGRGGEGEREKIVCLLLYLRKCLSNLFSGYSEIKPFCYVFSIGK